jgi:hypothetical protein
MLMLPRKRQRPKSGIERAPQREWPRHRRFVRSFECAVPGCHGKAVCAHLRTAANAGTALKPADWFTVPLCDEHHKEQEGRTGTFERRHGLNLFALAAELAARSTDQKMKEAMKLVSVEELV